MASIRPEVASQLFLRHMSAAVAATQSCCDSIGKRHVWMSMLTMVVSNPEYRIRTSMLGFISYEPRIIISDHGVIVLTLCHHQVNVNLLVPMHEDSEGPLVRYLLDHIHRTWDDFAVDLRPLKHAMTVAIPEVSPRRFIPSRRAARVIQYIEGMVECMGEFVPVKSIVTDPRRLGDFTPISRMGTSDAMDTLYWHRFSCGTIVTFLNPILSLVPVLDLPPQIEDGVVINALLTKCCQTFVAALNPRSLDQCVELLEAPWIPLDQRRFLAVVTKANFGVSDALIVTTGRLLGADRKKKTIVSEMCIIYECVCDMATHRPAHRIAEAMLDAIDTFGDREAWNRWMLQSAFIYALIDSVDPEHLERLCHRHTHLVYVLAFFLSHHDEWTHDMRRKAFFVSLCDAPSKTFSDNPIDAVRARMAVLTNETACMGGQLIAQEEECPPCASRRSRPRRDARPVLSSLSSNGVASSRPIDESPPPLPPETLDAFASSFQRCVFEGGGMECILIGSGIFHTGSDADIVVRTPPFETLRDAYDRVWDALRGHPECGWVAEYDRVTDHHVAVIRGRFEGLSVDLQVLRDGGDTEAERQTGQAIRLSKSLSIGSTDENRRHVAILHEFARASSWKGHRLCRLPGIALTCLALVVGRGTVGLSAMDVIARLRDAIAQETPIIDFDELEYPGGCGIERPSSPLVIIVNEMNIATRLRAVTTRHLTDTLAFTLERGILCSPEEYEAWRRRHMIACLGLVPRQESRTVSMTLHSVLSRIEGHPLIDSAFVSEDGRCGLILRVTLSAAADVGRYGFRPTDELRLSEDAATLATVTRGGRRWELCTKDGSDLASSTSVSEAGTSVTQLIRVPGTTLCVPNAPHLRVDLVACFDSRHWTVLPIRRDILCPSP